MFTRVKTADEIAAMRESGKMLATVLQFLHDRLEVGMSTKDLAGFANDELKRLGGIPAFLGYQGFPDVICISINEEVVHGIPRPDKIIADGDIVSLDFGVNYRGMITDSALSLTAGKARSHLHEALVKNTELSLQEGIAVVCDGVQTGDIGHAVEVVLKKYNYGIVRDLVGHGVGHFLHEEPNVPNYGRKHTGSKLAQNMTIAIEPMATLGTDRVTVADDGWTILTADNSWSAHFEHTILITEDGAEIITKI